MKSAYDVETTLQQFRLTTCIALDRRILDDARAALAQTVTPPSPRPWYAGGPGRIVKVAAAFALAAAVLLVALVFCNHVTDDSQTTVKQPKPTPRPKESTGTVNDANALMRERAEVDTLFAARDVEGLIETLKDGRTATQLLAAQYLGQIGDERAIPALSVLAAQWQEAPFDNPFQNAIDQIKQRLESPEPNAARQAEPSQAQPVSAAQAVPVLTGRITDVDTGLPLGDVQVRIAPSGGGSVYESTTDSNGVYGFDAIEADGAYSIFLNAPEHVAPAVWETGQGDIELRRSHPIVKDFVLAKGAAILVAIVNEAGKPVQRASVFAAYVSDEFGKGPKRPIRSNDKGIVVLGGLRADEYWVTVSHPDYALAGRPVVLEKAGQVEPIEFILQQGVDVVGVATCSDGLPAAGWRIEAKPKWWHSVRSWPGEERVAEDGTFVLPHILPGAYRLEVYIPVDGGSRGIWSTDVNLPPETGLLDFHIPKPSPQARVNISGTVVFTGGDYDRGFWVNAYGAEGGYGGVSLHSGERQFVLTDLAPGLYDLEITIEGRRHDFKNIEAPSEGVVLEVPIRPEQRFQAVVVDKETRRPVTRFWYRSTGENQWHQVDDPAGAFEATARGSDAVSILIRADGYGDAMATLSTDANEPTVVEMTAPLALVGTVVDQEGWPVEGATVSFRYRRSGNESPEGKEITVTDAGGRFTVPDVPPSETYHWFVFRHPDYARSMQCIEMAKEGTTATRIVLEKGATVEGILYDWRGNPLPETDVYFMDENTFSYWAQNRARLGKVTTDADGYYRIEHLPEVLCYAFRDDPDNQLGVTLAMIMPRAGQTLRLDIGGSWRTSGRLVRAGEPVANAKLLVTYQVGVAQGFKAYTVSDALGRFSFYGLPTGRRPIYWAVPGRANWNHWVELAKVDLERGIDLDLGDLEIVTADVTIDLVLPDRSVPTDRWDVSLYERRSREALGRKVGQQQRRRDPAEPFVFTGLSAGHYDVVATREGYPTIHDWLDIELGQSAVALAVTIPSGTGRIAGTIEMADDSEPWPLQLQSEDGRVEMGASPDADGAFEFGHLPAGDYRVARSRWSPPLARVHLAAGEYETVRIQADPADDYGYLVVLVVTEEGVPLATPDVWLARDGEVVEPHFNTDDGKSFAASPGTYTLCAEYPGFRSVRQRVDVKTRQARTIQEILQPLVVTMRHE